MASYILTEVSYGKLGTCINEAIPSETPRDIAERLAHGEFDPRDPSGLGLLRVIEMDAETCVCTDITAQVCKLAEHYIVANDRSADGNVVRLLNEQHVLPDWVAAIVDGQWLTADVERDLVAA